MSSVPPGDGRPSDPAAGLSAAALFTILWESLADVLGPAAAATLLKRAARRAATRNPELAGLTIQREGLLYGYTLPRAWNDKSEGTPPALRELVTELRPILVEMTGQVVIRHLERSMELRGLLAPWP